MREIFAMSPTELRAKAARRTPARHRAAVHDRAADRGADRAAVREPAAERGAAAATGAVRLRLPYRPPVDVDRMFTFLADRAIPGIEEVTGRTYARSISLPNGGGILRLSIPDHPAAYVDCELILDDLRDLTTAVQRCRRLLDLDADPVAISGYLSADPTLGPLVTKCPGRRVPGHVDGDELAIRAVLGQQVSVAAARRLAGRLVADYGKPLARQEGTLTHLFPDAPTIAGALPAAGPGTLPMPRARGNALTGLAAALASGDIRLDPGADREHVAGQLLALPGIGPWTASYISMRALADPDAFLPSDIGVRDALRRLDHDPRDAARLAERWRPWRSYAVHHLWASIEPGGN
jgi:AraC family transcriptional regulator of adaptative response / DNA-3-methyladenine glycosylase II